MDNGWLLVMGDSCGNGRFFIVAVDNTCNGGTTGGSYASPMLVLSPTFSLEFSARLCGDLFIWDVRTIRSKKPLR